MTSSDKQTPQASTEQPQPASTKHPHEQPFVSKGLRRVSPEDARELGRPPRNELIISPVPRSSKPKVNDDGET